MEQRLQRNRGSHTGPMPNCPTSQKQGMGGATQEGTLSGGKELETSEEAEGGNHTHESSSSDPSNPSLEFDPSKKDRPSAPEVGLSGEEDYLEDHDEQ